MKTLNEIKKILKKPKAEVVRNYKVWEIGIFDSVCIISCLVYNY